MNIIFKVTVATNAVPGPLLGDGAKTIVTMLYPSTLTEDKDSMGARQSVVNQASRQSYTVARFVVVGLGSNTNVAYLLARGATNASGRRMGPYEELPPIGHGDRDDTDLGDFDLDAAVSGEGVVVYAEVR